MIDPAEITSVITKLTVEVDRKESEVIRIASALEVANRRIKTLEGLLDTFLKQGWREGDFAFQEDLLEAPKAAPAPAPAEPSLRVSKPE